MIVCYPPSASGYRGWRSTEDVVYPQEVGFHCVSGRVSGGVSGELLLEVREQWCPASVDVYLGKSTREDVMAPATSTATGDSNATTLLYASAVFTCLKSTHLVTPSSSSSRETSVNVTTLHTHTHNRRLQMRIKIPNDIEFSFIRLMVYPSLSDDNPNRVCEITGMSYLPSSPHIDSVNNIHAVPKANMSHDSGIDTSMVSGIQNFVNRKRIRQSLKSSGFTPKFSNLVFSDIKKWRKKLLGIIPSSLYKDKDKDSHVSAALIRIKSLLHVILLEMNYIVSQIAILHDQLETCLANAAETQGKSDEIVTTSMRAMVVACNKRCDVLVKRQHELVTYPSDKCFRTKFGGMNKSMLVDALMAAWTPQVLSVTDIVQKVIVKEFWQTRDVFCRLRPSLHRRSVQECGHTDLMAKTQLAESKSELLINIEPIYTLSEDLGSCFDDTTLPIMMASHSNSRLSFLGVMPGSLIEHCFLETWLKPFMFEGRRSANENSTFPVLSNSAERRRPTKKKILETQVRLINNLISLTSKTITSPPGDETSTGDALTLFTIVASQCLLRGNEDLWLASINFITRLHTKEYSKCDLCKVDYSIMVYVLTLTLPAVLIGRFNVLDNFKASIQKDKHSGDSKFTTFKVKSLESISCLFEMLASCPHIGPPLIAAVMSKIINICLCILEKDGFNSSNITEMELHFKIYLVKITCGFLEAMRKLLIRYDFRKNSCLDPFHIQKLACRCLKIRTASFSQQTSSSTHAATGPIDVARDLYPFLYAMARGILVLCKSYFDADKETRDQTARDFQRKAELRRKEVEDVRVKLQQHFREALTKDAKMQRQENRRKAKQMAKLQRRSERQQREKVHREQCERQKYIHQQHIKDIVDANHVLFSKKRELCLKEIRTKKENEREKVRIFQGSDGDIDSAMGSVHCSSESEQDESSDDDDLDIGPDTHQSADSVVDDLIPCFVGTSICDRECPENKISDSSERRSTDNDNDILNALESVTNIELKFEGDLDRIAIDACDWICCQFVQLRDATTGYPLADDETVVFSLNHYLYLRPLQKLFASHSDFTLLFGKNNLIADEKEEKSIPKFSPLGSPPALVKPITSNEQADGGTSGGDDDDSDLDIDAILELSINEFNRQETFKTDPVQEMLLKKERRKSMQNGIAEGADDVKSIGSRSSVEEVGNDLKSSLPIEGLNDINNLKVDDDNSNTAVEVKGVDNNLPSPKDDSDEVHTENNSGIVVAAAEKQDEAKIETDETKTTSKRRRRLTSSHTDVISYGADETNHAGHQDLGNAKTSMPNEYSKTDIKNTCEDSADEEKNNFAFISYGPGSHDSGDQLGGVILPSPLPVKNGSGSERGSSQIDDSDAVEKK